MLLGASADPHRNGDASLEADFYRSRSLPSRAGLGLSRQSRPLSGRMALMRPEVAKVALTGREAPTARRSGADRAGGIEFWADGAHRLRDRFPWIAPGRARRSSGSILIRLLLQHHSGRSARPCPQTRFSQPQVVLETAPKRTSRSFSAFPRRHRHHPW